MFFDRKFWKRNTGDTIGIWASHLINEFALLHWVLDYLVDNFAEYEFYFICRDKTYVIPENLEVYIKTKIFEPNSYYGNNERDHRTGMVFNNGRNYSLLIYIFMKIKGRFLFLTKILLGNAGYIITRSTLMYLRKSWEESKPNCFADDDHKKSNPGKKNQLF